tara:strand:+ start:556 stop:909 length:354 start_codon:yes stop_codon:yes gene_type:complete
MQNKTIRDLAHIIAGFTFLYCIGNATYTNDFWLWQKIVGSIFIGLAFGGFIGASWEFVNKVFFDIQGDINDIFRTAIGGFLGCLTACFLTDVNFITFWLFWSVIALIIADIIRLINR